MRAVAQNEIFFFPGDGRAQDVGRDQRPHLPFQELAQRLAPGTAEQTFPALLKGPSNGFGLGFVREQRHLVGKFDDFFILEVQTHGCTLP